MIFFFYLLFSSLGAELLFFPETKIVWKSLFSEKTEQYKIILQTRRVEYLPYFKKLNKSWILRRELYH